jgi:hypothetical protein
MTQAPSLGDHFTVAIDADPVSPFAFDGAFLTARPAEEQDTPATCSTRSGSRLFVAQVRLSGLTSARKA